MDNGAIRDGLSTLLGGLGLRVGLFSILGTLCLFLLFSLFGKATLHLFLALFTDLGLLFFVLVVADGVLKFKLAIVLDLEGSLHFIAELHRSEVQVAQRRDRELAVDGLDFDLDRDLLEFFLLLALKNDHLDLRGVLHFVVPDLTLAHELDIDVDVLVWLQLALHGRDREHLLRQGALHLEVEADWVLTLILQVERELLGLTNSHGAEVQEIDHRVVQRDVEGLGVDGDSLLFLLDSIAFDVFNFQLDLLKEFVLSKSVENDLDGFGLARL